MNHKQISMEVKGYGEYKANGVSMAMIDEDICDLIRYLNAIPAVKTYSSCQQCNGNYVWIWMVISSGILRVSKRIYDAIKDIGLEMVLRLEYNSSCSARDSLSVQLSFPRECLEEVTEAMRGLSGEAKQK